MSTRSSFRAQLARRGAGADNARARSASRTINALLRGGDITAPVDVARALTRHGVSLRKAHETLNRLADGEQVAVSLAADEPRKLAAEFGKFGVVVRLIEAPDADVRRVRESLGLSQAEFAMRFALELDTVKNWEQGRNTPDAPARTLLRIIETNPEAVEAVLQRKTK